MRQSFKGIVANRTCQFINGESPEITTTPPLFWINYIFDVSNTHFPVLLSQ